MNQRTRRLTLAGLKVGLLVTLALVVIFFAILFGGNIRRLLTPSVTLYADFQDVRGLRQEAPVWISGIQVGTVRSVRIEPKNIRVTMTVDRDALSRIRTDSRARILTIGLLGDTYVDIMPGSTAAPEIRPGGVLQGVGQPGITEQLETIMDGLKGRKGTIGKLLEEDTAYDDLVRVLSDVKKLMARVKESHGTLNSIITDQRLYENVNGAAEKLNRILDKIDSGQGAAGSVISDRELKRELHSTLKEVNALVRDIRQDPGKYFKFSVF